MNLAITDSTGRTLTVTTDARGTPFDAIACSPHADGFTQLNAVVGDRIPRDQMVLACQQSISRGEICILPRAVAMVVRVLIVPNAGALDAAGRQKAGALMMDLFRATQTAQVSATSLLITHFGYMSRYPQLHVLGICDALNELKSQSFLGLKVLGFEVASPICSHLERDFRHTLTVEG